MYVHVLQFPSRRLPRFTMRTALLALALTALVLMVGAELGARDGAGAGSTSGPTAREAVQVPFAPSTVFNRPLQNPVTNLSPAPVPAPATGA
ncbi:hypothetical protein DVA67_032415 [Solirubrobacter sp. CPCC 204708]|uniref:Uncharacterized protein n=1 Tax=Solirubrobacter deserti TaxID=2282478 RepID=A0ABT4RQT9_9ACTN|nr:hypothetical protein [Solirubrobacter deserti]MBE2320708.1 hypothetical protein [Solirubrobacter deserti]MDA0140933.1 hypothetical protein [Solirubrobacter deserti]